MPDVETLISVPAIVLSLGVGQLSSDGLRMSVQATISNPNPMSLDIGDMVVAVAGQSGNATTTGSMSGRSIAPNSTGVVAGDILMPLGLLSEEAMEVTVATRAGVAGITLPIATTMTINMPDIGNLISMPAMAFAIDIGGLSEDGLTMSLQANISNPNSFGLEMGGLQVVAEDESGNVLATSTIEGSSIDAESTGTITRDIIMPLQLLNEETIVLTVEISAGAAGVSIPISTTMTINMPDLQSLIKAPAMALLLDIGELSSEGLHTSLQASITNPNPFSLDLGDLQMEIRGESGKVLTTGTVTGTSIGPASSGTLTGDLVMPLEVLNEDAIALAIDMTAGIAGISLPISTSMSINMPDIGSLISVPTIAMTVDIGGLSSSGLSTVLEVSISNPNPLSLDIGDLDMVIRGKSGNVITSSTIKGSSIGPNSSGNLTAAILMPLEVVNEESIVLAMETSAGVAGMTLPLATTATINMPDMGNMITAPEIEVYAEAGIGGGFLLPRVEVLVVTTITNDGEFDLIIGDLQTNMFTSDGVLVQQTTIPGAEIQASSTKSFSSIVTMDLRQLLTLIGSDHIKIEVESEAGIGGMNQRIPFGATVIVALSSLLW
jgi:LEA14-like dessication related protein